MYFCFSFCSRYLAIICDFDKYINFFQDNHKFEGRDKNYAFVVSKLIFLYPYVGFYPSIPPFCTASCTFSHRNEQGGKAKESEEGKFQSFLALYPVYR